MASEGKGRFYKTGGSRHFIYVSAAVAGDTAFPFKPGQALRVRIDRARRRLIVEPER